MNSHAHAQDQHQGDQSRRDEQHLAKDPVCGMSVDPQSAISHTHEADTFYFCCSGCRDKFVGDPVKYLRPDTDKTRKPAVAADTIWTCPMHPEIRRNAPGPCPICGMALEPLTPLAEEGDNQELADMQRRFWISTVLTAPLLWPMLGELIPAINPMVLFGHTSVAWGQLALATPVVLWGGYPFFVRGWQSVVSWNLNMFTLITPRDRISVAFFRLLNGGARPAAGFVSG